MRIKSRFVLITGVFLIAIVFYQLGRAGNPTNTTKFYLDGPNPDSGKPQLVVKCKHSALS